MKFISPKILVLGLSTTITALIFSCAVQTPQSIYEQGIKNLQRGNYKSAINNLTQVIEQEPNLADAYVNRGIARDESGDSLGAIEDYTQAISLAPENEVAYYNRANAYQKSGNFKLALENYNKAIEIQPLYAYAYGNRGITNYSLGNFQQAVQDLEKAANLLAQNGELVKSLTFSSPSSPSLNAEINFEW